MAAVVAIALLVACSGNRSTPTPPASGGDAAVATPEAVAPTAADCDALRDEIANRYRAAAGAVAGGKQRAAALATVADDAEMVLIDCRTEPARFVPCLRAAQTVEELEARCVIPLDDGGMVEGQRFSVRP